MELDNLPRSIPSIKPCDSTESGTALQMRSGWSGPLKLGRIFGLVGRKREDISNRKRSIIKGIVKGIILVSLAEDVWNNKETFLTKLQGL